MLNEVSHKTESGGFSCAKRKLVVSSTVIHDLVSATLTSVFKKVPSMLAIISSMEEFQRKVPLTTYDVYKPYIDRMAETTC